MSIHESDLDTPMRSAKRLKALRREAAAARADERRHPRIVPAVDVPLLDQLDQPALRQHDVGEVEAREFVLLRQRPLELAAFGELLDDPVVERPVVLELERADRMRDALERVADAVRVVVERVDAPLVAGAVMPRVADAVDRRIAQLTFGLAMSILSRSTCAPSANSPARMRRKRSRFSATRPLAIRAREARPRSACRGARAFRPPTGCRRRRGRCSMNHSAKR